MNHMIDSDDGTYPEDKPSKWDQDYGNEEELDQEIMEEWGDLDPDDEEI